jgi:hypothetical protein
MSAYDPKRTYQALGLLSRCRQGEPNMVRYVVRWTGLTRLFKRAWPSL